MPVAAGRRCSPYNFRFIQDDPLKIIRVLWPKTKFSREQEQILYSIWFNYETFAVAANMMGKDYIASFAVVAGFLTRWPCKIITTSPKADHLDVLWGEIHARIKQSKIPLEVERGGPLIINQQELRATVGLRPGADRCSESYVKAMVASDDAMAAMGGHHVPIDPRWLWRTMLVGDEASGIKDALIDTAGGWYHRMFLFGNAWPCNNRFRHAFEGKPGSEDRGGDIPRPDGSGTYIRKTFFLPVETSPNVRFARAQIAAGKTPTNEMIIEGIKPWGKYQEESLIWDEQEKCVKHGAKWYKGKELRLFPEAWLDRAHDIADRLDWEVRHGRRKRLAKAIGIDPSEGGDKFSTAAVDDLGLVEMESRDRKSEGGYFNTALIPGWSLAFMLKHGLANSPNMVAIDAGGGVPHADRLRMQGKIIRVIRFGAPVSPVIKRAKRLFPERVEVAEDKYMYLNLRAQMYHELSQLLDPDWNPQGFGIPRKYGTLREELAPIPKDIDDEGRYFLRSKQRSTDDLNTGRRVPTLTELIGHSPDEADALVLAVYAMQNKLKPTVAGVAT